MCTNSVPDRFQPRADARQQLFVVAHVLEHFHRHDAVEARVVERQVVHVAGDDLDVLAVRGSPHALR